MVETTRQFNLCTDLVGKFGRNIKSQTSTVSFANTIVFTTVELIKDLCLVATANTNTAVFD